MSVAVEEDYVGAVVVVALGGRDMVFDFAVQITNLQGRVC
jgi:hypothetical protein